MKYIVTGGAGFIGSKLANFLDSKGHEVVVIDNLIFGDESNLNHNIKFIKVDITDRSGLFDCLSKADVLFHLAAFSRSGPSLSRGFETFNSNVLGLINVLDCCRHYEISKVVFAGSATFYGSKGGLNRVGDPSDFLNMYGLSKGVGEMILSQYSRNFSLNFTVLRYFNVYGPGQPSTGEYALVIGIFIDAFKRAVPLEIHGDGRQRRDFIHVDDVVSATYNAALYGKNSEIYNVGYGKNISIKELADIISPELTFSPRRLGDSEEILADISKTIKDLKWEPSISIQEGINRLLNEHA
jgi:UDP-glucose 4-epimerase